jgi:hypothetical protein
MFFKEKKHNKQQAWKSCQITGQTPVQIALLSCLSGVGKKNHCNMTAPGTQFPPLVISEFATILAETGYDERTIADMLEQKNC